MFAAGAEGWWPALLILPAVVILAFYLQHRSKNKDK
jgi:hypothetical protein